MLLFDLECFLQLHNWTTIVYDCGTFAVMCAWAAEEFLERIETNRNYALLLLHLIDKDDVTVHLRVAGAIAFKNYVKRNWRTVMTW